MKPDEKRIIKELEDMISNQVCESIEVDVSARQIFDKFIKPLLDYVETIKPVVKVGDIEDKISYE